LQAGFLYFCRVSRSSAVSTAKNNRILALIKSISGIRGTIGGQAGENLTPQDIVECSAAYGFWMLSKGRPAKVVIGRDARISGEIVSQLVVNTLRGLGIEVVDLGLSTTPTVEMAVTAENAGGGIILTASHNPKNWNALKLLNEKGEFISKQDGEEFLRLLTEGTIQYAGIDQLGGYRKDDSYIQKHIDQILALPLVLTEQVKERGFKVVVDCINSTGSLALPPLLEQLGCEVILINETPNGRFSHNPEPLPEHLSELSKVVIAKNAQLGIAVDPDVDRLALIREDGEPFGEEYTLVAVADYVLQHTPGNTVSNLSSTRALREVTESYQCQYHASAVGEVNVVEKMKEVNAVIGGEGNGGIIYPALHYGRDAMVGIALFLSLLVTTKQPLSWLRKKYPHYVASKNKMQLTPEIDVDKLLKRLENRYANEQLNTIDGLKIDLEDGWIHLRRSNTEPIIRIYTEGSSSVIADNLAKKIQGDIMEILKEK
jgi:phosphomannomutase